MWTPKSRLLDSSHWRTGTLQNIYKINEQFYNENSGQNTISFIVKPQKSDLNSIVRRLHSWPCVSVTDMIHLWLLVWVYRHQKISQDDSFLDFGILHLLSTFIIHFDKVVHKI